jgi:hypothetical protein
MGGPSTRPLEAKVAAPLRHECDAVLARRAPSEVSCRQTAVWLWLLSAPPHLLWFGQRLFTYVLKFLLLVFSGPGNTVVPLPLDDVSSAVDISFRSTARYLRKKEKKGTPKKRGRRRDEVIS